MHLFRQKKASVAPAGEVGKEAGKDSSELEDRFMIPKAKDARRRNAHNVAAGQGLEAPRKGTFYAKRFSLLKKLGGSTKTSLQMMQNDIDSVDNEERASDIYSTTSKEPEVLIKKKVYTIHLSLFFGVGLFCAATYDLHAVYAEWSSEGVPGEWHTGILYCHILSFYLLTTGFIIANETNQRECQKFALVSFLVNMIAFILRLSYEIVFIDYVPTIYYLPSG